MVALPQTHSKGRGLSLQPNPRDPNTRLSTHRSSGGTSSDSAAQKVSDSRQALTETPAKFDAFLSYSHAADGRLAPAVQAGLQGLTRPRTGCAPCTSFATRPVSPRTRPCGRPSSPRCRSPGSFLSMASPAAAQSSWVQKEVEWVAPASPCRPVADRAHRGGPRRERHVGGLRLATHDGAPESPGPPIGERATLRRCTLGARSGAFVS